MPTKSHITKKIYELYKDDDEEMVREKMQNVQQRIDDLAKSLEYTWAEFWGMYKIYSERGYED